MVQVLNFFFVVVAGLTCLWLNHVSDETRVANADMHRARQDIVVESENVKVLQEEWDKLSGPERIQALAVSALGYSDSATSEVVSLDLLPRRGEAENSDVISTSASVSVPRASLHLIAARPGE
jgi:hypothetical protein